MEWYEVALLLVGGASIGVYGSIAGSASLLSVPLLVLMGLPINIAIATNRLGILSLETVSTARFAKEKKFKNAPAKRVVQLGLAAAVGATIGSGVVLSLDENLLNLIAGITIASVFVFLMYKKKLGIDEDTRREPHWGRATIWTFLFGVIGGFGLGGFGTFMTLLLLLNGRAFSTSAAISRAVGIFMSVSATVVFIWSGLINYEYAMLLAVGHGIGAWIGPGLALKKGEGFIRALFLVIVFIAAGKLILEAVL